MWQVIESDAREIPGALEDTCLIFNSQMVCRRFYTYPADWLTLSEDRLLHFMNQPRQSGC